jgi:hypothetical protein
MMQDFSEAAVMALTEDEVKNALNRLKLIDRPRELARQAEQDCYKRLPKYEHNKGMPFSMFLSAFKTAITGCVERMTEMQVILMLHSKLGPEALMLIGEECAPERHPDKTFVQYCDMIQEIFEPAAESESMKIDFRSRVQGPNEYPQLYYKDKKNMFYRAYPVGERDYKFFFGAIIDGLLNPHMKDKLRYFTPDKCSADTEPKFYQELLHTANVIRTKMMAKEISEAEGLGTQASAQSCSYQVVNPKEEYNMRVFKNEPVYAVPPRARPFKPPNGDLPDDRVCYYCGKKGHFIAQCTRKAGGLPPINQIEEDLPDEDEPMEEADNSVNAFPNRRNPARGRVVNRGRGTYPQNRNLYAQNRSPYPPRQPLGNLTNMRGANFNRPVRRVTYVEYQDQDGNPVQIDEMGEGTTPGAAHVQGAEEHVYENTGVNALQPPLQEQSMEDDFTPVSPFLGL